MTQQKKQGRPGKDRPRQDAVEAWLDNHSFEYAEAYVRRGRHLRETASAELERRWIEGYRRWAATAGREEFDHTDLEDIEAELSLRGEEPPRDAVKDETAALIAVVERMTQQLDRDPENKARFESELADEFRQFLQATRSAPKN